MSVVKRAAFWIEITFLVLLFVIGLSFFGWWVLSAASTGKAIRDITAFVWYLGGAGLKLLERHPGTGVFALFWHGLYLLSLFYFAQTSVEKTLARYAVPASILALSLFVAAVCGLIMGGLASTGAGH